MEKKKKRKQTGDQVADDPWKPTITELEVANYLHRKLPVLEARASRLVVSVFSATDAVDLLMQSPWAFANLDDIQKKGSKPRLFTNQASVIAFLDGLLQKQFFYKAVRVKKKATVSKKPLKSKSKKAEEIKDMPAVDNQLENHIPQSSEAAVAPDEKSNEPESSSTATSSSKCGSSSSSKRMRVETADEQVFVLDNDPDTFYVWVYEPPPGLFNWLAGSALLLGIVLCCLFPIWPAQLRLGAYYLTSLAAGLFGLLMLVALFRLIAYLVVWVFTAGRYAFWLFPNYFKDCGFFESFQPVYSMTRLGLKSSKKAKLSGKKEKSKGKDVVEAKQSLDKQD